MYHIIMNCECVGNASGSPDPKRQKTHTSTVSTVFKTTDFALQCNNQ